MFTKQYSKLNLVVLTLQLIALNGFNTFESLEMIIGNLIVVLQRTLHSTFNEELSWMNLNSRERRTAVAFNFLAKLLLAKLKNIIRKRPVRNDL